MDLALPTLVLGLTWFLVFLFSTTLHEAAHAFAALRLGDSTAYHGGQVSLSPWPHIRREPIGMVVIPILTFLFNHWMMGWASAPYDPAWARRYPRRAAIMSLAGPASNLALFLAAAIAIRGGQAAGVFAPPDRVDFSHVTQSVAHTGFAAGAAVPLSLVFSLNLLLFLFNLLPLPPLDGSGVLPALLSERAAESYAELRSHPAVSLLGLVVAWRLFPLIYRPLNTLVLNLLYPGSGYH